MEEGDGDWQSRGQSEFHVLWNMNDEEDGEESDESEGEDEGENQI
jgi:hypothetical protein